MNNFLIRLILIGGISTALLWRINPALLSQLLSKVQIESLKAMTPQTSEPVVKTQSITVEEIQKLSELTTASLNLQLVIPVEQSVNFGGFEIGKTKVLYIAKTKVQAGINLNKLTEANIQVNPDNSSTLILPEPEILDIKLDHDRSKLYDTKKNTVFAPDNADQLVLEAQKKAIADSNKEVCDSNLLKEANQSAKQNLETFFQLTKSSVNIKTTESSLCK
jgi:hypothetical protein